MNNLTSILLVLMTIAFLVLVFMFLLFWFKTGSVPKSIDTVCMSEVSQIEECQYYNNNQDIVYG